MKSQAIYIGRTNSKQDYPQASQLYQTFAEITRIVARKVNLSANQALTQYLSQCNKGQHVVLKSYSSFSKSILNRQCFLYNFCKIFETQTNMRNGIDYYQLFRLLCSDFPKEIVTGAVRIIQGVHDKTMEILLPSEKILNALYITFIYGEFMDTFVQRVFHGSLSSQVPVLQIFYYLQTEHPGHNPSSSKPPLVIIYQILLNLLCEKGYAKQRGMTFLSQDKISGYILDCVGENKNGIVLSYDELVVSLLQNKQHQKIVNQNIFCFDNSSNWVSQAAKLLNTKQNQTQQPLNSKKMKKK